MHRVLLVDDDVAQVTLFERLLRRQRFNVECALTGAVGIQKAATFQPHVALVDLKLPDMSGLDVLRDLRIQCPRTRCVVLTGFGTCSSAVQAMRLGALDVLEKPLSPDALIETVRGAMQERVAPACSFGPCESHSLKRWANVVVRAIESPTDPRTILEWGRFVGVSSGGLRNWCRIAHLSSRRSLLFARVLRAVVRHRGANVAPQDLLNVVDTRTLTKLFVLSGGSKTSLASDVGVFLEKQQLIVNPTAVAVVRALLTDTVLLSPARPTGSQANHGGSARVLSGHEAGYSRAES